MMVRFFSPALALFGVLIGGVHAQDCPIADIATTSSGEGTGVYSPSTLELGWDASTCSLEIAVDTFLCCNVFVQEHFVAIGSGLLPGSIPLGDPFLAGSELLIALDIGLFGPFGGTTSTIDVPADAGLIGLSFAAQAAPVFFTTVNGSTDFGISQAVVFTFE